MLGNNTDGTAPPGRWKRIPLNAIPDKLALDDVTQEGFAEGDGQFTVRDMLNSFAVHYRGRLTVQNLAISSSGSTPETASSPGSGPPRNVQGGFFVKLNAGTSLNQGKNVFVWSFRNPISVAFHICAVKGHPPVTLSFEGEYDAANAGHFTLRVFAAQEVLLPGDLVLHVIHVLYNLAV